MTPTRPVSTETTEPLPAETRFALARLQSRAWGIAAGLLFGLVLMAATLILVLNRGPNMGQHLSLLSVYLPGYSVSVGGSFIGFLYAFVIGYVLGRVTATVYHVSARTAAS